jgi:histidinol-phosphate/aromatic aminotransferase/cobyric acid decarboxylase-like protein/choline kinase
LQALILAAGMGNRLGKYTQNNTKCMLDINGKKLIERALDAIDESGIKKCILVVGYKKENLINFLGTRYRNIDIIYVANDIYYKTNNIYSLYLAKDFLLQDDTVLLESDLIFENKLIADILNCPEATVAAVAKYEAWMDGTVVQLADNNVIANFIPKKFFNYDDKETYYKTVNIYKFSRDFSRSTYVPFLEAYSQAMGTNEYYEQVLRVIATLDKNELKAFILDCQKWYEIDDVQDKTIAETIFSSSRSEYVSRVQRSYGGYWRFPRMLDFCYLVNPYFPPAQMQNEMKAYFTDLIGSYPSGLNTQNLLAAKLFNIDEETILTGNGASELIRALQPLLRGTIGITYPTFNEYPESFCRNEQIAFIPDDFNYTRDDLITFAEKCDNLLLINPDNPSGNFIPLPDVIELADLLRRKNKRLILDESFADFADTGENQTFIKADLLSKYQNCIVIKSLSKSYGVPGIRLGVLASGDRELLKEIRTHLSIWNINSFGEYFLQIIGKHLKNYQHSCGEIAKERERFRTKLLETGLMRVYPSQANYFLCKLNDSMKAKTARELTEYLLASHNIFIKDLTGKKGIPGGGFIRIAIRGKDDNDVFTKTLTDHCRA